MAPRLVVPAEGAEDLGEAVVRVGAIGIDRQGTPVGIDGLRPSSARQLPSSLQASM